jgi:ribosomal protein L33
MAPSAADALRKLAGHWPNPQLAVSLDRMRCKTCDGENWTTVCARGIRERLGLAKYDPVDTDQTMISLMKAAERLGAGRHGGQVDLRTNEFHHR